MKLHLPTSLHALLTGIFCLSGIGFAEGEATTPKNLVWSSGTYISDSTWYLQDESGNTTSTTATFTNGDNITFDSTSSTGTLIHGTGATEAGTITLKKDMSFGVNSSSSISGIFKAENNTVTRATNGGGSFTIKSGSNINTLVNHKAVTVEAGSTIRTLDVREDLTLAAGQHTEIGNITVKNGNVTLQSGGTIQSDKAITIKAGTADNAVTTATIETRTGADQWTGEHIKAGRYSNDYALLTSSSGTATLTNVEVTVEKKMYIGAISFTNSLVTLNEGTVLSTVGNYAITFDDITLNAGASLAKHQGKGSFTFNGDINLTLNALEDSGSTLAGDSLPSFSTSVLLGTMNNGSSLTLSFDSIDALSSFQKGDSFVLTLDGLTLDSGYTVTENSFSATGWNVVYDEAMQGSGYTALTLTKAVPEPTTATLSLLALAGLAARRRRK